MSNIENQAMLKSKNLGGYKRGYSVALTERILMVAEYIKATHDTIRQTAQVFGYSKTTIHTDVSKRLPNVNAGLYMELQEILDENFAEKHIRGGNATKIKFENLAECNAENE